MCLKLLPTPAVSRCCGLLGRTLSRTGLFRIIIILIIDNTHWVLIVCQTIFSKHITCTDSFNSYNIPMIILANTVIIPLPMKKLKHSFLTN